MIRAVLMLLVPVLFFGAPKGSSVSSGQAQIQVSGPNTTIQTSHQAVIDWDSFSVKRGEIVEFIQPSSHSSVINRVGREASVIDGFLKANGRVYLLNPNGVLVGKTGVVSCGSFLATTLDFDTAQCLGGGNLHMNGKSAEVIMNCGTIQALSGDVILLARAVINEGTLEAKEGIAGIAAAGEVLLKPEGRERLFISMSDEGEGLIENGGLIQAAHAELKADGNVYRLAINQTGVVEATGIGKENGKIVLRAEGATVENSGTVQANSGSIHLIGDEVHLEKGTELNVSGSSGGGEILIGGDYQGNNPEIPKARCVSFDEGALANASGIGSADGGRVILWSDQSTTFEGTILARGGDLGGNGGFIEISSPGFLAFKGRSDLRAASGEYGTLLLDPTNVLISDSDTAGVSLKDGTYVPIADTAVIKASDLTAALSAGNVLVTTQSDFENAGDIEVQSDVTWGESTTLHFYANRDFKLGSGSSITSSGDGSIQVDCGRSFAIPNGGGLFSNGSGTISVTAYTGSVLIKNTPSSLAGIQGEGTGNIEINAMDGITLTGTTSGTTNSLGIDAVSGDVLINMAKGFEVSGDITFDSSSEGTSLIASENGNVFLRTGKSLYINGPTTSDQSAGVYAYEGFVILDIGKGIHVFEGATGSNAMVQGKEVVVYADNIEVGTDASYLGAAQITATDSLLALAKKDIVLKKTSAIASENALTLVADFHVENPLKIGKGNFELYSGAEVGSDGPVRIFTPKRQRMVIESQINEASFIPGPLFIDSQTERWGTAYPNAFGGFPFTIFYKTGVDPLIPTKTTQIFAEMFAKLQTYDELLFNCKCFLFGYDKDCYDRPFHPEGVVSSFDLFCEEVKYMVRQKYRNYELKYVESL